jgi:Fe-S cluster assembly scaffold protein SufB
MQKYGLKVTSPFEIPVLEVLEFQSQLELKKVGNFVLNINKDINIEQKLIEGVNHLTLNISGNDLNINLNIKSTLNNDQISDVRHVFNINGSNIKLNINGNIALLNSSRVIYRSLINSSDTSTGEGNQKIKFLMLSNVCEVDAEPSIDSTGEEFKTSHGISIGGMNQKVLSYLNIHGLNQGEGENLILESDIFN